MSVFYNYVHMAMYGCIELWLTCEERAASLVVERGLCNVNVAAAAAVALLELCHACSDRLTDQFDSLTAQCLHALKLPHRDSEVAINVLKGASCLIDYADTERALKNWQVDSFV